MDTSYVVVIIVTALMTTVEGRKPNIVIFLADDLGYGDLGCYGNESVSTPNIDRLAREGVKMTQHLAAASVCTPSRAALLTGRYPVRSGMAPCGMMRVNTYVTSTSGLPEYEVTFAELTKQAGYRNGLIGKWHLGLHADSYNDNRYHPLNNGFDYFYGLIGTNMDDYGGQEGTKVVTKFRPYWYTELFVIWAVTSSAIYSLFKTGTIKVHTFLLAMLLWSLPISTIYIIMDNYTLLSSMLHRNYDIVEQPIRLAGLSQRFVKEGMEFIENSTEAGQPFLLLMSWNHMHTFIRTAPEFEGRTKLGRYGDGLQELDWSVGEILGSLQDQGVSDNTLVYFTSDNGGHIELAEQGGSNGIMKGGKSHGAPDGGIRVPGFVKWPGKLPANTVTDEMTSLMDIFNLVSSATGISLPSDRHVDGRDIIPLLKGESTVSPHEFMFHYCGTNIHGVRYRPRTGKTTWKLVTHEPKLLSGSKGCVFICSCNDVMKLQRPLLYDVTSDPGETSPINIHSDVYDRVSKVIQKAIEEHTKSLVPVPSQYAWYKLAPNLHWQPCCNGVFPFNCQCIDPKYPD